MDDLAYAIQELLFPGVSGLAVTAVYGTGPGMRVEARCTPPAVACPGCEQEAARVHSSYLRFPVDLSAAGRTVTVALRVRRFFCDSAPCPRRTFVEQVPGLTRRHGQVTERLRNTLGVLGLALAGRAGARMAGHLGVPFSRSTLLRRVMDLPDPAATAPRAVGVDDFALRRGHVYGTVVIDADSHQVLDLLPERDADTLIPWLEGHPEIEVICRDRSGAYADAAATAAPQAQQVADRFHLWQNLATATEKTVAAYREHLKTLTLDATAPEPAWETPLPEESADHNGPGHEEKLDEVKEDNPTGKFADRARAHHALVHELLAQGMSLRGIAQHLGWGRHTVQRFARAARWQDMVKGRKPPRRTKLDPFKPYLKHRWTEEQGQVTILDLHREITERGWRGHYSLVRDWIRRALPAYEKAPPPPPTPSVRQVTGLLTRHPGTLTEDDKLLRKAVLARSPELATAADLVSSFAEMLTTLSGTDLPAWINQAAAANLPGISSFATGLNSDYDAVTAGLTTHWNSGPVEGAVNRIKMLKRQMFGRAGFGLLRKRVLLS
ncbi:transposase [Streptomyces sp. Ag82_O1-15]|uniref:ISL3 family transposase n=1 Tax=Streptomyces sp. Ag82_O1-15 TaxID=1938855 RepID=UPI000BB134EC|nr:ISL3 family transposase [Streptomyces sp. Ag82_O1-15]PBC93725.1 transposase [Streptomyces sp. Ag82_O1-15]